MFPPTEQAPDIVSEREHRAYASMARASVWRDEWPKRDSDARLVDNALVWFLFRFGLLLASNVASLAAVFGADGILFGLVLAWPVAIPGGLIHGFFMLMRRGRFGTRIRRVMTSITGGLIGFGLTITVPASVAREADVALWGLALALTYGTAIGLIGRPSPPLASRS